MFGLQVTLYTLLIARGKMQAKMIECYYTSFLENNVGENVYLLCRNCETEVNFPLGYDARNHVLNVWRIKKMQNRGLLSHFMSLKSDYIASVCSMINTDIKIIHRQVANLCYQAQKNKLLSNDLSCDLIPYVQNMLSLLKCYKNLEEKVNSVEKNIIASTELVDDFEGEQKRIAHIRLIIELCEREIPETMREANYIRKEFNDSFANLVCAMMFEIKNMFHVF